MNTEQNECSRINSLGILKIICFLLMFWHHSYLSKPPVDLGARVCEVFFVSSGFLVAYNHAYKTDNCSWKESYQYLKKKLCSMWPLHFFCCVWCFKMGHRFVEIFDEWPKLLINLFLLQSWYNDSEIFFAYNGVSWFLSSILFCYFLSPLLMMGLKTNRSVSVSFILVGLIRIITELLAQGQWSVYVPVNFHVFPVIRAMDFYLGMTMFGFHKCIMAFF